MRAHTGPVAAWLSLGSLAAIATIACGTAPEQTAVTVVPASPPTRLQVVNRSTSDMEIYAVQGSQAVRVGVAAAGRTTEFPLSGVPMSGGGTRFEARQLSNNVVVNSQSSGTGTAIILQIPGS